MRWGVIETIGKRGKKRGTGVVGRRDVRNIKRFQGGKLEGIMTYEGIRDTVSNQALSTYI